MEVHDKGVEIKSHIWKGKRVAVGVCGGIGAIEVPKICRELRRHGALTTVFVTPATTQFISVLSLEWGSDSYVVEKMDAGLKHFEPWDCVVIVPLTLNTLNACAAGICDNPVNLLIACQIANSGRVVLVPAMNAVLARHPLFRKNLAQLEAWGCEVFSYQFEEGRIKVPTAERLVTWLIEN